MSRSTGTLTSEEIEAEFSKFLRDCSEKSYRFDVDNLSKRALTLLIHLPGSREAVLEYISTVFYGSCSRQLPNAEFGAGRSLVDDPITSVTIPRIYATLVQIVDDNPKPWAPLVASWSLNFLGKLFYSFANDLNLNNDTPIRESEKHWSKLTGVMTLIKLWMHCVRSVDPADADTCLNALTESLSAYNPHLHWVVVYVAAEFPEITTMTLDWGLRNFSVSGLPNSEHKLNCVIDILIEIAARQLFSVKYAVIRLIARMMEQSEQDDETTRNIKIATVPFLLKLASKSQALQRTIVTAFLDTLSQHSEKIIRILASLASGWVRYFGESEADMALLAIKIAMTCDVEAPRIIATLLDTYVDERYERSPVKDFCHEMLEMILEELLDSVVTEIPHSKVLPFLGSIRDGYSAIAGYLLSPHPICVQTAVRLLCLLAAEGSSQNAAVVITAAADCLARSSADFHLAALARLVGENDAIFPAMKSEPASNPIPRVGYLGLALEYAMRNIKYASSYRDTEWRQLFKNLATLMRWENTGKAVISECAIVSRAVMMNLDGISELLMKTEDFELAHDIAESLDRLSVNDKNPQQHSLQTSLKVTRAVVRYFFICIRENDTHKKLRGVKRVLKLLSTLCSRSPCARVLALRELLSDAIFNEPAEYFGANVIHEQKNESALLLRQNHKQGTSAMMAQKNSSVFHAGIIGQGPRIPQPENSLDKETITLNSTLLVDAIKASCSSEDATGQYSVNLDAMTMVSLLLVELVSPDVMYNGLPWPDEEFTKVTVERDLHIRRIFRDRPVLWTLLELTARHRPALAYCSVLLRAIAATVMANWNPSDGKSLANVMALGQLLPPPLSCLRDVLPILNPSQINTVMRECIWAYMHENVPSPALFTLTEGANIAWRDTDTSMPNIRFTDTLRLLLLATIDKSGPLYATLFYNEHK